MDILTPPPMTKLLLVCMGNRCRSPMAQIVTLHLAQRAGLADTMQVDSAGTHAGHHTGPPDPRAKTALSGRGYAIVKSRQVIEQDFGRYDLILAMDQANLNDLRRMCPANHTHKLRLFLEFAHGMKVRDVPDPYYGSVEGFERVLDLCEAGARGLVERYQTALR
jgi:protein-tyrosine phosphatase